MSNERGGGMPLVMAGVGEESYIKRIKGKDETKNFLEKLGFVVGGKVMVVSKNNGNIIVNVKDSRVAISKEMAARVMI
ncbi:ferrous iron transport protein A [Anaerofustis stercorihominis]|uniref:FeoA domain protein n=1 Tax=Anaerofustis stercorihominis DSM 17244 TaxID=445971 RepID=B1C6P4_9FIRM|nr:FeoA family protein [Anaerofustis stercorihominis]EDS72681.1 FeoA domain protein [Anaerofustis stercorihominis DSM 17244]MCQ4794056.1 ferrous iron transport protein A [Anaerofustis stercorihominis]